MPMFTFASQPHASNLILWALNEPIYCGTSLPIYMHINKYKHLFTVILLIIISSSWLSGNSAVFDYGL